MKTSIELSISIDSKLVKIEFDVLDNSTPNPIVKLPTFDEERMMIDQLLIDRYKAESSDYDEIPTEAFVHAYALSELKKDLAVISKSKVISWAEPEKLVMSLLETIVIWHIEEFGRLSRRDVEGYTTECVMVACALMTDRDTMVAKTASSVAGSSCTISEKRRLYKQSSLVIREKYFEHYVHSNLIDALDGLM